MSQKRSCVQSRIGGKLRRIILCFMSLILCQSLVMAQDSPNEMSSDTIVLEAFQNPDENGFPQGWDAQRSKTTAQKTYTIRQENGTVFLEAKGANQRVYTKNISWDPRTHPILSWKWRVRAIPENSEFVAAIYPSLDTDLMFIPVNTKYVWSVGKAVGERTEGGMFGSTEVVIRSGTEPIGEWVEERVNVYEDFLNFHQHEPAPKAWGISLLGGPGVEIDFGPLEVHPQ